MPPTTDNPVSRPLPTSLSGATPPRRFARSVEANLPAGRPGHDRATERELREASERSTT
ncbi:hypothetical protein [Streptomyces sp. NPDC002088]|uniref:hypothetical protein n=1 Tax=Streptomyces sp. NPDC002088 TaxID=3154665 RepID=UPI00332502C9